MISYRIEEKAHCVFVRVTGTIDTQDLLDFNRKLFGDHALKSNYFILTDLREVDNYNIDSKGVRIVVDEDRRHERKKLVGKKAFVCTKALIFGMLRMYQILGDDLVSEIGVYRDLNEALGWIGLGSEWGKTLDDLGGQQSAFCSGAV